MLRIKIEADTTSFYDGEELVLTMEETDTENGILMTLKGALRSDTAHHIQDELDAYTVVGVKVTIDFKDVTFAAPSVLKALITSQQRIDFFRQGEITLRNIPDAIYREMDDTGITELLMIEE